jgi:hypothetical protein
LKLLARRRLVITGALVTVGLAVGGTVLLTGAADASSARTKHSFGAVVASPAKRAVTVARRASGTYAAAAIPDAVDLTQWAVPAGDQGPVGSCVSWTVGYSMSGWYAKKNGLLGAPYAPLFLYSQITNGHGGPTVGTSFESNLNLETAGGIDTRADYTQGDINFKLLPTVAQKENALRYRLTGWTNLYVGAGQGAAGQQAIKNTLANGDPVALGIDVYDNFLSLDAAHDHYDTPSGAMRGTHSVAILGYDSYGVRVENSWGPRWASNGFATLSWAYVDQHSTAAYVFTGFNAPKDNGPAPHISLVTPASGPWQGGTTVTIKGSALAGATVNFGSKQATNVVVSPDGTSLTAVAPAGFIGRVNVSVSTIAGPSNAASFLYGSVRPVLATITPDNGPMAGGTTVTLTGTDFQSPPNGVTAVRFGPLTASSVTVSPDGTSLTAVSPAGRVGTVVVQVITSGGISNAGRFTYNAPPPPLVTLAAGTNNVLRGQSASVTATVTDVNHVNVNGAAVLLTGRPMGSTGPFVFLGSGRTDASGVVTFTRPLLTSTEFKVTAGTTVSSSVTITVTPPPTITRLSSASGPALGGQQITITGTLLTGGTVEFGTIAATVVSIASDGTSMVVTVPTGRRGPVAVIVTAPSGTSGPLIYIYTV